MPVLTDPKSTPSPSEPDQGADADKKPLDLSLTQLIGGALAAMTAAYLGSRLSVVGTVVGAAIASMVAGVGGALYTASLRHTRDKVKSVWTGRVNDTPTRVVVTSDNPSVEQTPAVADAPAMSPRKAVVPGWRTGRFWKRMLIGVVAIFALAVGTITALELVSGQALSGGQGTTVERVRKAQPAAPSESSESPSAESSESPSAEPSESPSDGPTEDPTGDPTETQSEPNPAPTQEPTEQSTQSSAPAEPSAADGTSADGTEGGAGGTDQQPGANPGS